MSEPRQDVGHTGDVSGPGGPAFRRDASRAAHSTAAPAPSDPSTPTTTRLADGSWTSMVVMISSFAPSPPSGTGGARRQSPRSHGGATRFGSGCPDAAGRHPQPEPAGPGGRTGDGRA